MLGVDCGKRRVGLAWSDASGVLARAWKTIPAGATPRATAAAIKAAVEAESSIDPEPVGAIVVGLPRRLNGDDTDQTTVARALAVALRELMETDVHLQDERLTSVEAESRLAVRERDWRLRKARIDAEAAAIILQDYLDGQARAGEASPPA